MYKKNRIEKKKVKDVMKKRTKKKNKKIKKKKKKKKKNKTSTTWCFQLRKKKSQNLNKKKQKQTKTKRVTRQSIRNIELFSNIVTLTKSFSKIVKTWEKSSKNIFVDNFDDKKIKKIVNLYDFIEKLKNESSFSIKKNKTMFKNRRTLKNWID